MPSEATIVLPAEARARTQRPPGTGLHVLGLAGSLRRDSYNRRLLQAARDRAPAAVRVTLFDDLALVPPFSEDLDEATGGGPEAVVRLRQKIRECDGLLISTPEYNQSVPGVLKNAIDWLSLSRPDAVLEGKPVAIMGATVGDWGTRLAQRTLRQILFATESLVLTGPAIYIRRVKTLVDASGAVTDGKTLERLERLVKAFSEWIELVSGGRARMGADAD